MVTFSTTVYTGGGTTTGIIVPDDVMAELTPARKVPVVVTLNGYEYRTSLGWYRGAFMLPLSAEHRAGSKLAAGDAVEVTLAIDDAPRVVVLPDDFTQALEQDAAASAIWPTLSYTKQNAHVLSINGAKTPETRARRIAAALAALRG